MTLKHLLLASSLWLIALPANADSWWVLGSEDQTTYEQALADLRAAPADAARLAAFANAASRIGNFEAAIGALESILLQQPELSLVRLELGVLYFRVAAYSAAQFNIQRALEGGLSPQDEKRGREFLSAAEERLDGTTIQGSVGLGLGWDSNPSARTSEDTILGTNFGVPVELSSDLFPGAESDGSVLGFGRLIWREDLGNQYGETWDTTANTYWRWHFDDELGSIGYLRATTGPRLSVQPGDWDNAFFRPFVQSAFTIIGDDFNSASLGAGATFNWRHGIHLSNAIDVSYRYREMLDDNDEDSGHLFNFGFRSALALTEDFTVTGRISGDRNDTEADYRSSWSIITGLGINWRYDAPGGLTDYPWELDFSGQWQYSAYDEPNPFVAPGKDRDDNEYRVVLRNTIGLSRSWFLFLEGGATWVDSSIPNYTYDNQFVSGGAIFRF